MFNQPIEEKWKETLEDLWWGSFDNNGEKNSHEYDKMVSFIENLLEQERKIMAGAIEMSKQGWIDEGRIEEKRRMSEEVK